MTKLAFLGLGVMGAPMAGHLARAGYEVTVYNRTATRAEKWVETYGGKMAATPAEAAKGAGIVFTCVGNDEDMRDVVLGADGVLDTIAKGAMLVDHTTTSAELARELGAAAADKGFAFIDAPVSGGQAGAENGKLAIMCGGSADDFARALPVLEVYGKTVKHIGETGAGQLCKMANQIAIAGLVQALSESLNFTQKAGLDGESVLEVITGGAAGSWQMENRGKTMLADEFDFGFAVDWMRKDLGYALAEGARNNATLPVTEIVNDYYGELQEKGHGRLDTSSLIKRLR